MNKVYEVAGHLFALRMAEDRPEWAQLTNYQPFETDSAKAPLFTLTVSESQEDEPGELVLDPETEKGEAVIKVFRTAGGWKFEMAVCDDYPVCARMLASEDFSAASLVMLSNSLRMRVFAINNSLMLLYAFCTAGLDTLEMHASVVKNDGRGYLSLGHSGAGKSTHSRQWLEHIPGSTLLNDDNPIIRFAPDGVLTVYGSPWSGKTPCYVNDSCPVGGFICIHQAPHNKITLMPVFEAYAAIYSSCSGLKFESAAADGIHSTIEKTVLSVPCWSLECRADREAALVCSEAVKNA